MRPHADEINRLKNDLYEVISFSNMRRGTQLVGEIEAAFGKRRAAIRRKIHRYFKGLVYMGMGEKAQALDNLEQAYSAREGFLRDLRADPRFAPLRSDPRFRDLVRRVGLLP